MKKRRVTAKHRREIEQRVGWVRENPIAARINKNMQGPARVKRRKLAKDEAEVRKLLKQLARLPIHAAPIAHDDVPTMVHRVEVETAQTGQSYEEANWAKLSPMFRKSHNRLRKMKGLSPIPDPKVDLWVPPKLRKVAKIDEQSPDAVAAMREFLRGGAPMIGAPGGQGFQDKGLGKDGWIE